MKTGKKHLMIDHPGSAPPFLGWAVLSLAMQMPAAVLLGHYYDTPRSMAAGYMTSMGLNPYVWTDLSEVFGLQAFQGITSIGYPPPWPLLAGILYKASYGIFHNVYLYNLALKIPVMAAHIGSAFLVRDMVCDCLEKRGKGWDREGADRACKYILFNPFIIIASAAWGQIDVVAAVLALGAIRALYRGDMAISAFALAFSNSVKPIALPLVPLAVAVSMTHSLKKGSVYCVVFCLTVIALCLSPFAVFGWDGGIVLQNWYVPMASAGGMSWLSFLEIIGRGYSLPGGWKVLGFAWVPAVACVSFLAARGEFDPESLIKKSAGAILVFFLTRSWLSEPNLTLAITFAAPLAVVGAFDKISFSALWILPLIFGLFNYSLPQLLMFLVPDINSVLGGLDEKIRTARILGRCAVVVLWQITGWRAALSLIAERVKHAEPWRPAITKGE